jgi:ribosome-associated heat shock protein Hsp15
MLYEETAESLTRREEQAAARKAAGGMIDRPAHRPDKQQRRQIHRFKNYQD